MNPRSAKVRDPIKHAFLNTLTGNQRDYLRSKAGIPSRSWVKEPEAVAIAKQAHAAGTYAPKTLRTDILCSLRNFINRQ